MGGKHRAQVHERRRRRGRPHRLPGLSEPPVVVGDGRSDTDQCWAHAYYGGACSADTDDGPARAGPDDGRADQCRAHADQCRAHASTVNVRPSVDDSDSNSVDVSHSLDVSHPVDVSHCVSHVAACWQARDPRKSTTHAFVGP